jgi:hypothetical protein
MPALIAPKKQNLDFCNVCEYRHELAGTYICLLCGRTVCKNLCGGICNEQVLIGHNKKVNGLTTHCTGTAIRITRNKSTVIKMRITKNAIE